VRVVVGKKVGQKDRRRKQVLHSARDVFARKGFHETSVSDIIRRAGIARGTFYLYFKNKRHIFYCLLEALLQELDQHVETIRLGSREPPPLEQLRDNLARVITFSLQKPEIVRILFHHATGLDGEFDRMLDDFYGRIADRIEWALKTGIEIGLVRQCNTRLVAFAVMGSMLEIIRQLASKGIPPRNLRAVLDNLIEFGLRGVLVEKP
jgi:TetR/AcrR family transcriptional regulator, fatty acid metabolism regulator protein